MTASTIVSIVYALDIKPDDNTYIDLALAAMEVALEVGSPSRFLGMHISTFPLLLFADVVPS